MKNQIKLIVFTLLLLLSSFSYAQNRKSWDNQKAAKHGVFIKQYEIANNKRTLSGTGPIPLTVWDASKPGFCQIGKFNKHNSVTNEPQSAANTNLLIKVFPVPAEGLINVLVQGATKKTSTIIYNSMGQIVTDEKVGDNLTLDISSLVPGVYFVNIFYSNNMIKCIPIYVK